jgi:hypothetical protein
MAISKIERVPLRTVWKQEVGFSAWLQDNIDVLNDVLDVTLVNVEREQSAGAFSVDLVAEDADGNAVVIENQLAKSDHDHLGKLITYLTALGARTAVWIVANPRPEHVGAIAWLNESATGDFYLVKVEAVQIDGSPSAPLLTVIVGPSDESREVGATKKEMAERNPVREQFWAQLLERSKTKTKLHSNISPNHYSWIGTGAGRSGLTFVYTIRKHEAVIELYIDRGKDSELENTAVFEKLAESRDEIDAEFGEPLEWQSLEGKRACRIATRLSQGGYRDESVRWPQIHDAMIDAMIRLEQALRKHVDNLTL